MNPCRGSTRAVCGIVCGAAWLWISGCDRGSNSYTGSGGRLDVAYGEVGLSPGQFAFPRAIAGDAGADGDGTFWVVDKMARVQRIRAADGVCLDLWQMPTWEQGKPVGLCVWSGGGKRFLIVADTHYHRVMVYDMASSGSSAVKGPRPMPEPITQFGKMGRGPGEFIFVTDIAVLPTPDGSGIARLYVGEYGENDRISVYEPGTTPSPGGPAGAIAFEWRFSWGKWGNGDSTQAVEFNRPQGLDIDLKRRELLVADAGNHRIGRFTLDGTLVKWFGGQELGGSEPGRFTYPYGILSLDDGTALVCENGNGRVQRVDIDTGASRGIWDKTPEGRTMATPWGLARVGETVYVLDSGNNRVMRMPVPKD